ncbi:MAG: Mut7-C RNAse domain-containing protein [Frankiaceae bacterium]
MPRAAAACRVGDRAGVTPAPRPADGSDRVAVAAGGGAWPGRPSHWHRRVARVTVRIQPFSRCLRCNGRLLAVAKAEVAHLLSPGTRRTATVSFAARTSVGCSGGARTPGWTRSSPG